MYALMHAQITSSRELGESNTLFTQAKQHKLKLEHHYFFKWSTIIQNTFCLLH